MEDALSDYEQTLLFVSHDRFFIDKLATRIWALADGQITDFRGGYREYCAWKERQAVFQQAQKSAPRKEKKERTRSPNADRQRARLEKELAKLEEQIAALDREAEENASDYQKLMEIDGSKDALEEQLMILYGNWEELNEK